VRVGVAGFLTREANVRRACLLLLILAGPVWADPVRIVGPTEVAPYKIVRLKAEGLSEKAGLRWKVTPLDSSDPQAVDWATGRNVQKPEWVAPPGRYRVELVTGVVGPDGVLVFDDAEVIVTIGTAPPPGPVPPGPTPPGPTPPGPTPDPALVAALTAAYRAEIATDPDGRMLAFLAGAMDKTAEAVAAAETNAALIAASKKLTAEAVGPALAGTRAAIGKHLNATLPGGVVTLTADNRPQFVAAYKAVAAALRGVQR
jgi:hypothetical protein